MGVISFIDGLMGGSGGETTGITFWSAETTKKYVEQQIEGQEFKTINGESIKGEGNIEIDIPDMDEYYTKTEADETFMKKGEIPEDVATKDDIEEAIEEVEKKIPSTEGLASEAYVNDAVEAEKQRSEGAYMKKGEMPTDVYTKAETDEAIEGAIGNQKFKTVGGESIIGEGDIEVGNEYEAGEHIKIEDNVISTTGLQETIKVGENELYTGVGGSGVWKRDYSTPTWSCEIRCGARRSVDQSRLYKDKDSDIWCCDTAAKGQFLNGDTTLYFGFSGADAYHIEAESIETGVWYKMVKGYSANLIPTNIDLTETGNVYPIFVKRDTMEVMVSNAQQSGDTYNYVAGETLVSYKTINGESIIGEGNIEVATEVPVATKTTLGTVKGGNYIYPDANGALQAAVDSYRVDQLGDIISTKLDGSIYNGLVYTSALPDLDETNTQYIKGIELFDTNLQPIATSTPKVIENTLEQRDVLTGAYIKYVGGITVDKSQLGQILVCSFRANRWYYYAFNTRTVPEVGNIRLSLNQLAYNTDRDTARAAALANANFKAVDFSVLDASGNVSITVSDKSIASVQFAQGYNGAVTMYYSTALLKKADTFKTINGESIIGEGDIEIKGDDKPTFVLHINENWDAFDEDDQFNALKALLDEDYMADFNITVNANGEDNKDEYVVINKYCNPIMEWDEETQTDVVNGWNYSFVISYGDAVYFCNIDSNGENSLTGFELITNDSLTWQFQDKINSGEIPFKTINGEEIYGTGNIEIQAGGDTTNCVKNTAEAQSVATGWNITEDGGSYGYGKIDMKYANIFITAQGGTDKAEVRVIPDGTVSITGNKINYQQDSTVSCGGKSAKITDMISAFKTNSTVKQTVTGNVDFTGMDVNFSNYVKVGTELKFNNIIDYTSGKARNIKANTAQITLLNTNNIDACNNSGDINIRNYAGTAKFKFDTTNGDIYENGVKLSDKYAAKGGGGGGSEPIVINIIDNGDDTYSTDATAEQIISAVQSHNAVFALEYDKYAVTDYYYEEDGNKGLYYDAIYGHIYVDALDDGSVTVDVAWSNQLDSITNGQDTIYADRGVSYNDNETSYEGRIPVAIDSCVDKIVKISQADYDALDEKDEFTLYIIIG